MNHELPDVQAGFRKGRGIRDQIANINWIIKKAKCLFEEDLQIAMKRREVKSKGEKKTYKHLNVEFQRIARRDKKAFLRDQCKEIEENNRMGKTRDLFKKIRDTKQESSRKTSISALLTMPKPLNLWITIKCGKF